MAGTATGKVVAMTKDSFYFVVQTGKVSDYPIDGGNFYVYELPLFYKGQVLAEVEHAHLGPAGLEYPAKFLRDLTDWEHGLMMQRGRINFGDTFQRDRKKAEDNWRTRNAKAKAELKYAVIQVSTRKHRIIKYAGTSYYGEKQIPHSQFVFITGLMSQPEATALLNRLMLGGAEPEYEGKF